MINNMYLGIDVGSISSKCVVIDEEFNIITSSYIETNGNPIAAVKQLLNNIVNDIPQNAHIMGVGTTGSARNLVGKMLDANVIKNEITAHAIGSMNVLPDVKTILEIGGQDSKIIIIRDGIVIDYAMNTLCAAGTGSFLSSQAKRLNIDVKKMGDIALKSKNPSKIAARCTVFAESDLVHKLQIGHRKEDIIAGLCESVVNNYLNNVAKGKKIEPPIMFQGGVSKNIGVVKSFEKSLNHDIVVDPNGHLMGALGMAILAKKAPIKKEFSFDINKSDFETIGTECMKCPNNCEIILFKKDGDIIDSWGNRCPRGIINK